MDIRYKKLFVALLIAVIGPCLLAQQKVSKKIDETYMMTDSGTLSLNNKYGDVRILGWNKDNISIEIKITVNHKDRESAENLLERIRPNLKAVNGFVTASYEIADRSSGFFAKYFDRANPFDYDKTNIQIDYTIFLPLRAEVDINNSFGDVIIDDWRGRLKAVVEHGDIWLNENLKYVDTDIKYGKLRTKYIDYGNIRIKNGSLDLEGSKALTLNSSGSDISLEQVGTLEIHSSKDGIIIGEAESINGDLRFSTMQLSTIIDRLDLSMKITDLKVAKIQSADALIVLNQESSEISLNIEEFYFEFDATLEEGLLRIPRSLKNIDTRIVDKNRKIREIRATNGSKPTGRISIQGEKGVILLKEK